MSDLLAIVEKLPLAGGGTVGILSVALSAVIGILSVVVRMILTGRLVPRATLDDVRADRDARLAEAHKETDDWRAVVELTQRESDVRAAQVTELLELGRTTNTFIKALPGPAASKEPAP